LGWAVPLACVAAAGALAGCGSDSGSASGGSGESSSSGGSSGSTVKIAAPLELTGPGAAFGTPFLNALRQAVDYVNANGGVRGLGGARLELLTQDTASDPTRGVQMLRQMDQQQKPVVAVGPFTSTSSLAALPVINSLGLPYISPTFTDSLTDNNEKRNVFRVISRVSRWAEFTTDFLQDSIDRGLLQKPRSVAIVVMQVEPGPTVERTLVAQLDKMGIKHTEIPYDSVNTRDYSAIVARVKSANPDLVMGVSNPPDATAFAQAMTLQSWRPKDGFLMTGGGYYLNSFRRALGTKTDGWMVASYGTTAGSKCTVADELNERYQSAYREPLTGLDTAAASEIAVIVDALNRARSTDRDKFKTALEQTDMNYCDGTEILANGVKFDDNGDNEDFVPTIVQDSGAIDQVAVYPKTVARADPKWPAGGAG
jgi:branched-chain amino acid transport system substrate-binding protein